VTLEASVAAFIDDWTWAIPDWESWRVSRQAGHVETSPEKRFVVSDQELIFVYELTLDRPFDTYGATVRLVNLSSRTGRIHTYRHGTSVFFTLKPGEGVPNSQLTITGVNDDVCLRVRFVGHILLDFDEQTSLQRDIIANVDPLEDTDFKLICGDREFPCHKIFLRARSPVLRAAFSNSKSCNEFRVDGFSPDAVKKMLRFVYSNSIGDADADADLLRLADFFNIRSLTKLCQLKLSSTISRDNVFDLLTLAESVGVEADVLKDKVVDFIVKNYASLKETSKWKNLDVGLLNDILDKALQK